MPIPDDVSKALKETSILFVEDDPVTTALARGTLAPRVKDIYFAENGRDGLMAFVRFHPDLVITDIRMPKMDGLAMAASIREMHPETRIIVTTALDNPELMRQAIGIGICSYLPKPFDQDGLMKVVGRAAVLTRHRKELEKHKRLGELLLNSLPNPAMLLDRDTGQVLSANAFAVRLGLTPGTAMAATPFAMAFAGSMQRGPTGGFHPGTHVDFQGMAAFERLWDVNIDPITDSVLLFSAVDITERQRMKEELLREKAFIAAILENAHDGFAVVAPEGRVTFISPGMERLFGYTLAEMSRLAPWTESVIMDPAEQDLFFDVWRGRRTDADRIFPILHKTGERRYCRLQTSSMPGGNVVITGQDITGIKLAEERIRHMALHDSLTGLPNRQLLQDRLRHALAQDKRRDTLTAILYIDLDRFKDINDNHGHDVGDEVLKHTAERLARCVREADTVARMGGDEFVIVLPGLTQGEEASVVAERVLETLAQPLSVGNNVHVLGASIGIALHPRDGVYPDEILRKADRAMYETKKAGGMGCRFYTDQPA
ncbi:MAG: diguanylate cyclase domain-containing protein [Thermodesulfobacteriota bacterium]